MTHLLSTAYHLLESKQLKKKKCCRTWQWGNKTGSQSCWLEKKCGAEISQGAISQAECLLLQKSPKELTLACRVCVSPSCSNSFRGSFILLSSLLPFFFSMFFPNTRNTFIDIKFQSIYRAHFVSINLYTTLSIKCFYPYFIDEGTGAWELCLGTPSYTNRAWIQTQSFGSNPMFTSKLSPRAPKLSFVSSLATPTDHYPTLISQLVGADDLFLLQDPIILTFLQ